MPPLDLQKTIRSAERRSKTFGTPQSRPFGGIKVPARTPTPTQSIQTQNAAATVPTTKPAPRATPTAAPAPTVDQGGLNAQLEAVRQRALGVQAQLREGIDRPPTATPQQTAISQARERVTAAQGPTQQELTTQERLDKATEAEALGLQGISQETIPQGLITGQQAALQRQAAIATLPLEQQLARLQQQRTGEREAAQAELGFAQTETERQQAQQAQLQDLASSLIQAGATEEQVQGVLRSGDVNEALGLAAGTGLLREQEEDEGQFTLGKDQIRFDAEGNIVARGAAGGVGGGTGLEGLSSVARDAINNPAILDFFTPTEKGKIITELSNAGVDLNSFTVNKLSSAQRDQIAEFDDLIRQSDAANALLTEGLNTGPFAGRLQAGQATFGTASEEFVNYQATIDNMNSTLLRMRSGAAVTEEEFQRIKGFIPSVNEDEKTAQTKIANFNREMGLAQANFIKRSTETRFQIQQEVNKQGAGGETITTPDGQEFQDNGDGTFTRIK